MTKRKIACLCLAVLLLMPMLLTGCGKKDESPLNPYTASDKAHIEGTVSVANDNYSLYWSGAQKRFLLIDKASGEKFYSGEGTDSPIDIEYSVPGQQNEQKISGYTDCMEKDTYSIQQIDNGVDQGFRIVYSFDAVKIAVTVDYLLTYDGIEVRIPMDGMQEEENTLTKVHVAPFLAKATNDTGSYMMVPSGSGALIDAKRGSKNLTYKEAVYGEDLAEPSVQQTRKEGQIYLPVFGVMNIGKDDAGNDVRNGMLGIVEEGADCAYIYAQTGDKNKAYSNVYSAFAIRSKEWVIYSNKGSTKSGALRFSNEIASPASGYLSVRYLPLSEKKGEDITYNGMAARYRSYLQERGYLTEANRSQDAPSLSIHMMGSTQIPESFFGIPYQSDAAVTTLAQTQKIAEELKAMVGDNRMVLSLIGYGQGGLANVSVGGGFKLSSTVGKQSDMDALVKYAEEHGIVLSMNYELAQFQSGGKGIKLGQDTAMRVSTLKAEIQTYAMSTNIPNKDGLSWYLLARKELSPMMDKAIAAVQKHNVGGISIGSLNNRKYSDFRTEGYAAMSDFSKDVAALLNQCGENGLQVIADNANAYAALNADFITGAPVHSSRFSIFSRDIPFYALVFQGYVPMAASSINLAVNPQDAYLQAVATGSALQFTLCDTLHESIQFDEDTAFVSSRYADWKDQIAAWVEESADVYAKVGNMSIKSYEVDGDVSITTFEDGSVLLVNYADADDAFYGLKANSFSWQ